VAETVTVTRMDASGVLVSKFADRRIAEHHIASMRLLDKTLGVQAEYELSDSSPRVGSG